MKKIRYFFIFFLFTFLSGMTTVHALDTAINGFISQGYLRTDKNNWLADTEDGSFQFNDMALRFSTRLTSRLFLGIQFYARDLGDLGNDEITMDWFAADYYYNSMLGLKVGRMKIPYGFYNESRDADFMRTSIFLPYSVYPEQWRDSFIGIKGAGVYGNVWEKLSYYFQVGVLSAEPDGGMAKSYNGYVDAEITDVRPETCYVANIQVRPIEGFRVGYSYIDWTYMFDMTIYGAPGVTDAKDTAWVCSAEYAYGNLTLSSEYMRFLIQFDSQVNLGTSFINRRIRNWMEGYYGNIQYRFNDWFSLGVYYSVSYLDVNDKNGDKIQEEYGLPNTAGWTKETCISARFDIMDNWIAKLDIRFNDGTFNTYVQDNRESDGTVDTERYWTAFAAKVMYSF